MNKPKYIYIFGNSNAGFVGYVSSKEMAKKIKKYRTDLECHKIKYDSRCEDILSINDRIFELSENCFMSSNEEEYYCNSLAQFKIDTSCYINNLNRYYKYFRWSKDEKIIINNLIAFINDYVDYLRMAESDDELDEDTLFDNDKSIRYFIKYVIMGDVKK